MSPSPFDQIPLAKERKLISESLRKKRRRGCACAARVLYPLGCFTRFPLAVTRFSFSSGASLIISA